MLNMQHLVKPDFTCENAMSCFFNLNPLETAVYKILVLEGPLTAKELGNKLKKDRSTSYRALKNLMSAGLCYKETMTIEAGGYYHVYTALPPGEVKEEIERMAEVWYEKIKEGLSKFDEFERELAGRKGK